MQDSEARIDLLRQRAGLGRAQSSREELEVAVIAPEAGPSTLTTASGHINLFEDLERVCDSNIAFD